MAAEAAAGAWAAEEVVSTGVQAGVGAYMVRYPCHSKARVPLFGTSAYELSTGAGRRGNRVTSLLTCI